MEKIYLKIKIPKSSPHLEKLRNEGLFVKNIAFSFDLNRKCIIEIDEFN